jgi:hypothetical protein
MLRKSVVGHDPVDGRSAARNEHPPLDDHGFEKLAHLCVQSAKQNAMILLFAFTIAVFSLSFVAGRAAHAHLHNLQAEVQAFREKEGNLVSSLTAATNSLEHQKVDAAKKMGEYITMLQKLNTEKTEALVKVKAEAAKQLEEQVAAAKNEGAAVLLAKEKEKTEALTKVMTEKAEIAKQLEEQVAAAKKEGVTLLLTKEKEKAEALAKIEKEAAKILEEQVAAAKKEGVEQGKASCMMPAFDDIKKKIMGSELAGSRNAETEDSYIVRAKKLGLF